MVAAIIVRYSKFINIYREHFLFSIFLESRSVLGAKFSSAYNTSTVASKYIEIVKNHYPPNFQNFPKLCITFKGTGMMRRRTVDRCVGARYKIMRKVTKEGGKLETERDQIRIQTPGSKC